MNPAILTDDGLNRDSDQKDAYWRAKDKEVRDRDTGFGSNGSNIGYDVWLVRE